MSLKKILTGEMKLLRELTDACMKPNISDALIGSAFRGHVLSYRRILNEIEIETAVPEVARSEGAQMDRQDLVLEAMSILKASDGETILECAYRVEGEIAACQQEIEKAGEAARKAGYESGSLADVIGWLSEKTTRSPLAFNRPQGTTPTEREPSADSSGKAGTEARHDCSRCSSRRPGEITCGSEHCPLEQELRHPMNGDGNG